MEPCSPPKHRNKSINIITLTNKPSKETRQTECKIRQDGRLGACSDGVGSVHSVDTRTAVSAARQEQSGGVRKHADEWDVNTDSHNHLLLPHYHFPYRHRRPYLHEIGLAPLLRVSCFSVF